MPISPIAMATPSSTLSELVAFLTRPLILVYPAPFVIQLQVILQANFSAFFPSQTITSPFTFFLSPAFLPPTPIYAACLQTGVTWQEWIRALGGNPMYVFVMEGNLKVRVGEAGEAVTVWSAASEEPVEVPAISRMMTKLPLGDDETESPMTIKLREMLDSVRARNHSVEDSMKPISLPTLLATASTSESLDAAEVVMTPEVEQIVEEEDADAVSDTESDNESTTSSRFSEFTIESLTSVSTTSSPVSCSSELPALPSTPIQTDDKATTSPNRTPTRRITDSRTDDVDTTPTNSSTTNNARVHFLEQSSPIQSHYLSRSQRRLARSTFNPSKADIQRFTYEGGQTAVMTGGVMLGSVQPKPNAQGDSGPKAKHHHGKKQGKGASSKVAADVAGFGARGAGKAKAQAQAKEGGQRPFPGAFSKSKKRNSVLLGPDSFDWRARA